MCGPQLTDMMPGLGASQPQWAPNSLRSASGPAPGHGFQIRLMNLPPSPNVEVRPVPELNLDLLPSLPPSKEEQAARNADFEAWQDNMLARTAEEYATPLDRPEVDRSAEWWASIQNALNRR